MKIYILLLVILNTLVLASCSTIATKEGARVELTKEDPKGCKFIGDIDADDFWSDNTLVNTKNKLRNKAAEMGGNVAVMDTVHKTQITGRVFNCPK